MFHRLRRDLYLRHAVTVLVMLPLLCLGPASAVFAADCQPPVDILLGPVVNPANGHRYYLLENANWFDSEAQAVCLGGYLVTISDAAEQDWVWSEFSNFGGVQRNIWIGLTDEAVEGTFVWVTGEPLEYTNWIPSEPNNAGDEDYAQLVWTSAGGWNDLHGTDMEVDYLPLNGVVEVSDCGNGRLDPNEECDDGNDNPSDGCPNSCTICGNGTITLPEQCDDGNLANGDGCDSNCTVTACGNGIRFDLPPAAGPLIVRVRGVYPLRRAERREP